MAKTNPKPKQLQASKKVKFTEVQVRIHNTQHNFRAALSISKDKLYEYIDGLRKEAKDWQGKNAYKKFLHLPLVSFVDPSEKEEVVFKDKDALPKDITEIRTKKGTLIAKFT